MARGQRPPPDRQVWATTIDKAKIDAEPTREKHQYRIGTQCWFVVDGTWFLCEVVEPGKRDTTRTSGRYVAIKPVTGKDAERQVDWPYGTVLEFGVGNKSGGAGSLRLYERLRPLKARRP